jgi:hypothetical protein
MVVMLKLIWEETMEANTLWSPNPTVPLRPYPGSGRPR